MSKVAIIGFGNVGYHLAKAISKKHSVTVFGRVAKDEWIRHMDDLVPSDFDYLIITVPDSFIQTVSDSIIPSDCVILHTSGSRSLSDLSKHPYTGVMYPLQTFTKAKKIDFDTFPIFIETKNGQEDQLLSFVRSFGKDVRFMNSSSRKKLHLAAVFACNFTNHLYFISDKILNEIELSFSDMEHLAEETLKKALDLSPQNAQTGPAKRNDQKTLIEHFQMINNENWREIYELISNDIRKSQE